MVKNNARTYVGKDFILGNNEEIQKLDSEILVELNPEAEAPEVDELLNPEAMALLFQKRSANPQIL